MFTALADGWVEVGLTEGKVTVYMNVTQKKNTRIDISSGELGSLVQSPPVCSAISCFNDTIINFDHELCLHQFIDLSSKYLCNKCDNVQ